jgi:hypothetical protein
MLLHRAAPLDDADENGDHRQDQKDVDETSQRVGADHPEQPQYQQQNSNRPKHCCSFFRGQVVHIRNYQQQKERVSRELPMTARIFHYFHYHEVELCRF